MLNKLTLQHQEIKGNRKHSVQMKKCNNMFWIKPIVTTAIYTLTGVRQLRSAILISKPPLLLLHLFLLHSLWLSDTCCILTYQNSPQFWGNKKNGVMLRVIHTLHSRLTGCYAFTSLAVYVVMVTHLEKNFNQYNFTPPPSHSPSSSHF